MMNFNLKIQSIYNDYFGIIIDASENEMEVLTPLYTIRVYRVFPSIELNSHPA